MIKFFRRIGERFYRSRAMSVLASKLVRFSQKDSARELADTSQPPPLKLSKMVRLIGRAIPFMMPMMIHMVMFVVAGVLLTLAYTIAGLIFSDLWDNKMMVNDKLQPFQTFVLLADNTYLQPEFLTEEELQEVEDKGFGGTDLTEAQRKYVRNGLLIYSFIGVLCGLVLTGMYTYYPAWVWQNVNHYLRVAMVEKLEYLSLSFHQSHRSGDAIYRIYQDSSMIVSVLTECVIGPLTRIFNLIIVMGFLIAFDPILGLAILFTAVPMIVVTAYATPTIRRLSVKNRVANSEFTSRLQETFTLLKVIKANQMENMTLDRFDKDSRRALDAALYIRFAIVGLGLICAMVGGLVVIGFEYVLARWTVLERSSNVPSFMVWVVGFAVWNFALFNQAKDRVEGLGREGRDLVGLWCRLQDLFIGLERAFYFLDLKPLVEEPEEPVDFPSEVDSVSWNNVHFGYEDNAPVLRGVSLEATKGNITAIVGSTGSGKSTLMSLLLRLYDPQQGQILVNSQDVRTFSLESIRENTALAMQKNILFTGKVKENIAYALDTKSDEELKQAAEIAGASEFIEQLENGYETQLGERGSKLSAGQRQRLTIARAVIRDTPILILDEPTASLDAQTEHEVLSRLADWGKDKVVFLITHRLSTIRNADQIAFLKNGQISEIGNHDELMALTNGDYRQFVEAETVGSAETLAE